ncbi:MAG: ParD-like family protein [Colwellia sp.]|nr:ParD-like family protein [Colwellia sp.]
MGIVKISENLHEEIRKSSNVMSRSINSQAEFWIKMGMLSELNPTLTFNEIIKEQLLKENVSLAGVING